MIEESRRTDGRYIWLQNHLPSPAWSPAAQVRDAWWESHGAFEAAAASMRACLARLEDLGLRPIEADHAVERFNGIRVAGWAGERVAVIVAVESGATLSGLVIGARPGLESIAQLIRRAQRRPPPMVSAGGFWLSSGDRPALDEEIGGFLAPLIDGLGGEPDAVDLEALGEVLRDHERRIAAAHQVPWLRQHADDAWEAGRWADYVSASDRLAALGVDPDPERRTRAESEVAHLLAEPAWPLTDDALTDASGMVRRVFAGEDRTLGTGILDLTYDRMITDELWDAIERLRVGDPTAVDPAIAFLEADPWAFRTGYLKGTIMRRLRRCPLDPEQQARLRAVLLYLVEAGGRWEYREACRLAWRVADPPFMAALVELASRSDWRVRQRAQWMFDAIRLPAGT